MGRGRLLARLDYTPIAKGGNPEIKVNVIDYRRPTMSELDEGLDAALAVQERGEG